MFVNELFLISCLSRAGVIESRIMFDVTMNTYGIPLNTFIMAIVWLAAVVIALVVRKFFRNYKSNRIVRELMEWVDALCVVLVVVMAIHAWVFQLFKIPSGSMEDTLLIKDRLVVNKFVFGAKLPFTENKRLFKMRDPERGDVVIFRYPKDTSKYYVKRLIGMPGDVLEIKKQLLYLNGVMQDEPYVVHKNPFGFLGSSDYGPVTVKDEHYMMLGDNRDYSSDSRDWGQLHRGYVRGLAWYVYWPFSRRGVIH